MKIALVVLDATRKDHLDPYTGGSGRTPNVSRLAQRGITFTNCISGAPWTPASHATMLTGQYPSTHGVRSDDLSFPTSGHYLPETLSKAGVRTQGVGAEPWLSRRQGFDRGFDSFHDTGGHSLSHYLSLWPAGLAYGVDQIKRRVGTDFGTGHFAVHLFNHWAKRADSFTFVNISVAHSPYEPPTSFIERRNARPSTDDEFLEEQEFYRYIGGERDPDEDVWGDIRGLYAAGVTHADHLLGQALDGLDDDTWILLTADHGEHLGEDDLALHQFSLRDELINVPLIISHPSLEPRVADEMVSHIDIPPTIYDIASSSGFDLDAGVLPGRSLLSTEGDEDRTVFSEYGPPVVGTNALINNCESVSKGTVDEFFVGQQAAVTEQFKLVRRTDGTRKLYRRGEETTDIADEMPAVADTLESEIGSTLGRLPNVDPAVLDGYVDESVEDRLQELGYL